MKERTYTIVYMTALCIVATAAMTGVKSMLSTRIENNRTVLMNRDILRALDLLPAGADAEQVNALYAERVKSEEIDEQRIYRAYDEDGKTLVALGMEFRGQGFWGPIRGVLATDPAGEKAVGVVFLEHQETPGLGARIAEPWFLEQFRGKDIAEPVADGVYLVLKPEGQTASGEHEINAISGATRTSDSVQRIINDAVKHFNGVVKPRLAPAAAKEQ